jgi:protein-S-isoprenylcysteine O-methyltransferase Ste14
MTRLLLFLLGTAALVWASWPALRQPRSHGFTRFFAWVSMLALVLVNHPYWELDPFSPRQIVSWALLFTSPVLAVHAYRLLRTQGQPEASRASDEALLPFERTSLLVTRGAFKYIRHPMYTALIFLAWGAFLKHVSASSVGLVAVATVALWATARRDEQECLAHFGAPYADYMRTSKRFIPFVL